MGRALIGFTILVVMSGLLFFNGFMEAVSANIVPAIGIGLAVLGLLYGYILEWKASALKPGFSLETKDLYLFAAVFSGAVASYVLNVNVGLGAVVAASLVGLAAGIILPGYGVPIYCGAFAGMTGTAVFPNLNYLMIGAAIAGLIFVLAQDVFNGFGGKLGLIAFSGCVIGAMVIGNSLTSAAIASSEEQQMIIIYSIIAAVVTYVINARLKKGGVIASGFVGLTGGILLPVLYPDGLGATLAVMCVCASYAGMTAPNRISNEILMAVAGLFAALIFIYTAPHFGGAGGKLGTTAFGSVVAVNALVKILSAVTGKGTQSVSAQ